MRPELFAAICLYKRSQRRSHGPSSPAALSAPHRRLHRHADVDARQVHPGARRRDLQEVLLDRWHLADHVLRHRRRGAGVAGRFRDGDGQALHLWSGAAPSRDLDALVLSAISCAVRQSAFLRRVADARRMHHAVPASGSGYALGDAKNVSEHKPFSPAAGSLRAAFTAARARHRRLDLQAVRQEIRSGTTKGYDGVFWRFLNGVSLFRHKFLSMSPSSHNRGPDLTLVAGAAPSSASDSRSGRERPAACELDWSIYMARAQGGDRDAYRRLLEDVTPYLRSIAARHFRNSGDIEDTVQEVLLTVHAVRHTYDPARPFGPWLVAIANRRVVDGLRRQGRSRAREVALDLEHETFAAPQANLAETASDGRMLRDAIEQLPSGQRDAVRMLKLQEMSLKEAAAASGMTVAALKVATHRAVKSLRKVLGGQDRRT